MSLSIGVVNINYLQQPGQPVYRFMWALMEDPEVGLGDDRDDEDMYWDGGGDGENAFYQFDREGLIDRANGWATAENISDAERDTLVSWIENLLYREGSGTIMLHLSF